MDNDKLLLTIKGLFDEKTKEFKDEVNGVKNHMDVIAEDLRKDIRAVAEGHSILDRKIETVQTDVNGIKTEIVGMKSDITGIKMEIEGIKTELGTVKEYVIRVDAKLNEHDKLFKVIG